MSAALSQPQDPWAVAQPQAQPQQSAPDLRPHAAAAIGAAHIAGQSAQEADAAAKEAAAHRDHVDLQRGHIDAQHGALMDTLQAAVMLAQHLGTMIEAQQQLLAGLATMTAELRAPRKLRVTKRGQDGSISEAVSEVTR